MNDLLPFVDDEKNLGDNLLFILFACFTLIFTAACWLATSRALFVLFITTVVIILSWYLIKRWLPARAKIICSEQMLTLPRSVAVESDSSRKVLWNSIESIHLIHTANDGTDVLVFKNNKDEKILLDVYGFKKKDLYSFLIGVKGFAPSLNVDPILESLQLSSLGQDQQESEGSGQSFTRLWSDTLGFHAGNTSFVPLAPGTALAGGRVKICRLAAAGGMAAIYLASLKDGRIAVVKEAVIPASNDAKMTSKALELFKREAGFLGELKHPQIARLYDYFVEKNRHYMIIEYLEGTNLRQLVDEGGPLSPSIAIEYILQLTKIIAFLHERKPAIIHRDISPDNVIASKDFSIKLIDFGAANTFVGTATRTLVGKQAYMSPEQCKGRSTPLSDLYSIGSTLSFLLTGVDPVPLITSRPCQVKEGIEPGLEEIIERLTARDPDHRPQSARELIDELEILQNRLQDRQKPDKQESFSAEIPARRDSTEQHSKRKRFDDLSPSMLLNGRYEVIEKIGAGGQGTAYLARDMSYDSSCEGESNCLLKEYVIPEIGLLEFGDLNRLEENREAKILRRLNHPKVVHLLDYFVDDLREYLVTDYIAGQSLRQLVEKDGAISEGQTVEYARQLCKILEYLHGLSPPVVHLDLTPENVIVSNEDSLTLVDFTLAHELDGSNFDLIGGKHAYMPPEQFQQTPGRQSDLYALGATLYFLLTGLDPEPLTVSHPKSKNADIEEALDDLVAVLTMQDQSLRYPSIEELDKALAKVLEHD